MYVAHDDIYFVAKAPLWDDELSAGLSDTKLIICAE